MRSNIVHNNVVGINFNISNNRVEIIVESLSDDRLVVNKHRVFGVLDNVAVNLPGSLGLRDRVIRFNKPAQCIHIEIEAVLGRQDSLPRLGVTIGECREEPYDESLDEFFSPT